MANVAEEPLSLEPVVTWNIVTSLVVQQHFCVIGSGPGSVLTTCLKRKHGQANRSISACGGQLRVSSKIVDVQGRTSKLSTHGTMAKVWVSTKAILFESVGERTGIA